MQEFLVVRAVGLGHKPHSPRVRLVILVEAGTHLIFDGNDSVRIATESRVRALRLLRSVTSGMLLMWDRGLYSYAMVQATVGKGCDYLGRIPANVKFLAEKPLEDSDSIYRGFIHQESYVKKVVSQYRSELLSTKSEHPEKPEEQLTYCLITSLLDIEKFSAELLARVYAQRWKVENTIDELKIHLLGRKNRVRSQKTRSVVQEVYGWLLGHWAVRVLMFQAATSALCCSIAPK